MYRLAVVVAAFASVAACGSESGNVRVQAAHAMGDVHAEVSCNPAAGTAFDSALVLLHHMTYPQARAAFRDVAARDPDCAMAYWGIAMTLFQPMWPTRPGLAERELGWRMVQKAESLGPRTERERLFVATAEAFFRNPADGDYWARIRRWEEAAQRAHQTLPNDLEAASFYALAHIAVAQTSGTTATNHARAASERAKVLAANPRHPGAMHYLIHANDVAERERESPQVVSAYEAIAPDNPHALHMPTHIYVRLGDWPRVIDGNLRAASAALRFPTGEQNQLVWDEFPHAIEYLVYAHLQRGSDEAARQQLDRLQQTARLEATFKTAFHLASTAARYALERHAWAEAAELVPRQPASLPWDRFPWPEAVTVFAKGLGAAMTSQSERARSSLARLGELEAAAKAAGEVVFERNVRILKLALSSRIAQTTGKREEAVVRLREAAEVEEQTPKHAVTPAPTLPARELLGDLLAEQGRQREALDEYTRVLAAYPNRLNSLVGAARAAHALGDSATARTFYSQLERVADPATTRAAVAATRELLSRAARN
jgi:tetratricopeptide (TPR) repeat protein